MRDLHLLPKIRDSWSYIYLERCQIDQEAKAIAAHDLNGTTSIPIATLALLMLGPGTSITHSAVRTLADKAALSSGLARLASAATPRARGDALRSSTPPASATLERPRTTSGHRPPHVPDALSRTP